MSNSNILERPVSHKNSELLLRYTKCIEDPWYTKCVFVQGASILRMLEDWIGRDTFRDGCRVSYRLIGVTITYIGMPSPSISMIIICLLFFQQKYLNDFHFQNAKTADFWASLADVSLVTMCI